MMEERVVQEIKMVQHKTLIGHETLEQIADDRRLGTKQRDELLPKAGCILFSDQRGF